MTQLIGQFYLKQNDFVLNVEFNLPSAGITALFGVSGSGKTSLLRCIAGLEQQAKGTLSLGDIVWQDDNQFCPPHLRGIATVFQDSHLFPHLSVDENLRYGSKRNQQRKALLSYDDTLELLGITSLLSKPVSVLSGGQRQRVAIARALLANPQLLLMDEPLASLDRQSKQEILPYLERLQKNVNIPIVYVSHALDEVLQLADTMLLIDQGRVQAQDNINTLLTRIDLPLAHYDEACSIITGTVSHHEHEYHLTHINTAVGLINTAAMPNAIGETIKLKILARDVSISLTQAQHTSISNCLPVTIESITESNEPSKQLLTLKMGKEYLLAQITKKSVEHLLLQEKLDQKTIVYAQVKSVALS